jgi:Zn-dependent M28 family amino/carboxypeptidase
MKHLIKIFSLCLCCVISLFAQEGASPANGSKGSVVVATADELKSDIDAVPCKSKERLNGVKALFQKVGAAPEAISVEAYNKVENVVLTLPGKLPETIVIGAHYDVAGDGSCGAVDNWTGIVTLAHLYRTFKSMPQFEKTLVLVAFGAEEQGLVGSKAMTDGINKRKENAQYCAMVNIDSLGLAAPQALENISTKSLVIEAEAVAKMIGAPFTKKIINGASSDSQSFLDRKIPAITLSAMPDNWQVILHSKNDQAKHINPVSVYAGYRIALSLVAKINDNACDAYREGKKK